jgi:uncharacterized membrane protein YeaQ/YmgE (transglycosylase-associated protein family)
MNWLVWIIFGALAGWIASMITGKNKKMGALANIVVGIIGAFIGGWIMQLLRRARRHLQPASLLVAIVGAVVLLFVVGCSSAADVTIINLEEPYSVLYGSSANWEFGNRIIPHSRHNQARGACTIHLSVCINRRFHHERTGHSSTFLRHQPPLAL